MIRINLDDLTQAHVDECAPHVGRCQYSSPCIIGTLMSPGERDEADNSEDTSIDGLVDEGVVKLPAGQYAEAEALQSAFDSDDHHRLTHLLAKRGLVWPIN